MRSRSSPHAMAVLCVLAGGGCAQIFGINNTTSGDIPDAAPDLTVSLQLQQLLAGATLVTGPADLTGQTASFYTSDTAATPATQAGPGLWSADIADGTPPVLLTTNEYGDEVSRFWAFGQRHVVNLVAHYDHLGSVAPPSGAAFEVNVTLPTAYATGEAFQIFTAGSWSVIDVPAVDLPPPDMGGTVLGPVTIPFDSFSQPFGRPLTAITPADRVLVLRYVGSTLTGALDLTGFAQTASDPIGGVMVAVAPDQTLDVSTTPAMPPTRLATVMPAPTSGVSQAWYLHAAPGYLYALDYGPVLADAAIDPAGTGKLSTAFGNPFQAHGWNTLLTLAASASRTYTSPVTNTGVALYTGFGTFAVPQPQLAVEHTAALPTLVSINGAALATDGLPIALDATTPVDLTMTVDGGKHDFCRFVLNELVPDAGNTTLTPKGRADIDVIGLEVKVPSSLFTAGSTYWIRAQCFDGGYTDIAKGDLTVRDLPTSFGYLDSGVFTVAK